MSILAALFGWSKLPQWAIELAVIAALAAGFALYHHSVFEHGIQAQRQADSAASEKVEAQAAAATQAAQDAANRAEESYHAEITHNAALAATHPLPAIRLCGDSHHSGPGVPKTGAAYPGDASSGSASGSVPSLPRGDSGLRTDGAGPDVASLLGAWADKADGVSATLREYKARQP